MRSISSRTASMSLHSSGLRGAIPLALLDDGVGLDLDQPVRIDEARHLKHGRGRADVAEELAMHAAGRLPMGDVHEIDAGADDVLQGRPGILKRLLDDLQN